MPVKFQTIDNTEIYQIIEDHDMGTYRVISYVGPYQCNDSLHARWTFANFISAPGNQCAYNVAREVADAPGHAHNPLFIFGGEGLGRTHLMIAVGHQVRSKSLQIRVIFNYTDQFARDLSFQRKKRYLAMFRQKYLYADMLLLDDVQDIQGQERPQKELLHIMAAFIKAGKQVIITCDRMPKELPDFCDSFRARFQSGTIVELHPLDFKTRVAIAKAKARVWSNVDLDDDTARYIADLGICKKNIRPLEGAVVKVCAVASLTNQPITKKLAEEALVHLRLEEDDLS